jgi:hypothetical protein
MGSVLAAGLLGLAYETSGEALAAESSTNPQCMLRTLKGNYAYASDGYTLKGTEMVPFSQAGHDFFKGDGTVTGAVTVNIQGELLRLTYSGTYTLEPDCSGTMTTTDNLGVPAHFDIFVTKNGSELSFIQTDAGNVTSGYEVRGD